MDLTKRKHQLLATIPEELYKLEPGRITYFISNSGVTQHNAGDIFELAVAQDSFYDETTGINIVATDNESLVDTFAAIIPDEESDPHKVVVGTPDSFNGFVDTAIYGYDSEDMEEGQQPIIITIDPKDCPTKEQHTEPAQFTCPFMGKAMMGPELLIAKPEKGSKEEKKLIIREEKKLEKVLRECAIFEIELDIDKIKRKVKDSLKSEVEYQLILDIDTIKEGPLSFCNTCDIYVADGEEYMLKLTAVEKAVYLTFLLFEKGIRILDTFEGFRQITQKIYNQLPDEDKCEKTAGGILDKGAVNPVVYADTLRTYISHVRDEVADKITHPLVAQDFAIEGFKDSEFGIARSTPEIRAQIKKAFDL